MDPRSHPDHEGRRAEFDKTDALDSHRFPPATPSGRAEEALPHLGRAPAEGASFSWSDLRQSQRIRCSGSVEFRIEGSDEHEWGTLTDISLHGCYVEMNNTFPIGTNVHLVLKSLGARIQVRGIVRTSFPSLGMGIAFTEIEPGQHHQLELLLDALTGSTPGPKAGLLRENAGNNGLGQIDPIAFLDEMIEFFRKKPLLSREEFQHIAKRVRRP